MRFIASSDPVEPFRMLSPEGVVATDEPPLSHGETLEALELMKLSRAFDRRAVSLQRQGRFGTVSAVRGQEASVVGSAWALDPARDWIAPQYRELPALLRHGFPMHTFALYCMGNPAGCEIPDEVKVLPIQISLAAQLPQAVGLAWGLAKQRKDGVVLAYVGDGASSEGDFHEALNLAGVMSAPVVFVLQNNGWAISTPRQAQTAARTFAERGPGYGIDGVYVDGNDLFAVFSVVREAVERARAGGGATLVESLTWRAGAHNTADDPTKYMTEEDAAPWEGTDPIERIERYLMGQGALSEETSAQIETRVTEVVETAMQRALAYPLVGAEALFDHVYADPPPRLEGQREKWLQAQNGGR